MKKTKTAFLFILAFIVFGTEKMAAQKNGKLPEVLDNAQFRVLYEFSQQADKQKEKITLTDTMALNVGAIWSEYYDWHKVKLDSLAQLASERFGLMFLVMNDDNLNFRLEAGAKAFDAPRKPETARVYKERATQKITTYDYGSLERCVGPTYLVLEETVPPMDWTIYTDTATVLGYLCSKATASFRERTYKAWFTTEIPTNESPWKLYGLPWLILKAETTDGIFRFRAIELQNITNVAVAFPNDRKNVPAKNFKQINDYRKNKSRQIEIILLQGKNVTGYLTANPIAFQNLENEN